MCPLWTASTANIIQNSMRWRLYEAIKAKIIAAGSEKPELDSEFAQLRQVTGGYTVPGDVCESYEAVYNMLAELDEAYQS